MGSRLVGAGGGRALVNKQKQSADNAKKKRAKRVERRSLGSTARARFEKKKSEFQKRTEDGGRVDGGRGADAAVGGDAGLERGVGD